MRAIHYGLGGSLPIWLLLFADDSKATFRIDQLRPVIRGIFSLLAVVGFPINWEKVKGGQEIQWIGYWLSLNTYGVGVSTARRDWVVTWIAKVLSGERPE